MYDPTKPYKQQIKDIIKSTWDNSLYHYVYDGLYPTFTTNQKFYREIQHTDGTGTKGLLHWENKNAKGIANDAFYMNFNDMLMAKATPTTLQNHIIVPEDDHDFILEVMTELANLCIKHEIIMTGGETSIQNNMQGMELSVTMTGHIPPKFNIYKDNLKPGDTIYGLLSNGPHSNGFTLIRQLYSTVPNYLLEPTRNYGVYKSTLNDANGIMHITGGAYTKLHDIMNENIDTTIELPEFPSIFKEIQEKGNLNTETMLKTFNCGIGMVFSYPKGIKAPTGIPIGEVKEGTGKLTVNGVNL